MNKTSSLEITAIPGIPLITTGDDLVSIILHAINTDGLTLEDGDVLVISSKIVSKSEGRLIDLRTILPGDQAREVAELTGKDPRIVELVLRESSEVSRKGRGVLITRHRLGFVSANAGIDQSNIGTDSANFALLLPEEPDRSAKHLRERIGQSAGANIAVIISDSHGRPFRLGNVGVAIGVSGVPALIDLRGQPDLFGRAMMISMQGYADLIASAAHLVCGEGNEGLPVILVRGLQYSADPEATAADLLRPPSQDLYK